MSLQSKIFTTVQKQPTKAAIIHGKRIVSYGELEASSNRIANFLLKHFDSSSINRNIIILLEKSPELIAAILGVIKSGNIFVPLDVKYPENRLTTMLKEAQANWVIVQKQHLAKLQKIIPGDTVINVLVLDAGSDGTEGNLRIFQLNAEESGDYQYTEEVAKHCYLYFTSGSTGTPKGVLGRHKSLQQFIEWEIKEFGVDGTFNCSQLTSPSFDPFLRDIFLPLCAGATLHIPPDEESQLNPERLSQWIEESEITFMHMTPSLFKHWVASLANLASFPGLKYILLAGEKLRGHDVQKFSQLFQRRIQLVNMYGPTETTLAKFFYRIKPEDVEKVNIPVGKPIDYAEAILMNTFGERCQVGEIGEVYIRTPFISSGYYNHPELTSQVFLQNPFNNNPRDLLYKTGDLGRLNSEGHLELVGRVDHQVKIRGVRIEPGEIENRLLQLAGVWEAVAVAKEEESGEQYLCAYLVTEAEVESAALRSYLAKDLPEYMIPAFFVRLDKMPLSPNGKIDRGALPDVDRNQTRREYVAPTNEVEARLARLWAEVLEIEKVGILDNFQELGGHSFKAISLAAKIQHEFEVKLSLQEIFKVSTVKNLAKVIEAAKTVGYGGGAPYVLLNAERERKVFAFPPLAGYGITYQGIAKFITTHAVYAFDFIEDEGRMEEYVQLILKLQSEGPYVLLGYSAGGGLAFEVGKALESAGHVVSDIIMLDSSRALEVQQQSDEELAKVAEEIFGHETDAVLKEYLTVEVIRSAVKQKIMSALTFRCKVINSGQVQANIHFIKSAKAEAERVADWHSAALGEFSIYQGSGSHVLMLEGEHLQENGEIVKAILRNLVKSWLV